MRSETARMGRREVVRSPSSGTGQGTQGLQSSKPAGMSSLDNTNSTHRNTSESNSSTSAVQQGGLQSTQEGHTAPSCCPLNCSTAGIRCCYRSKCRLLVGTPNTPAAAEHHYSTAAPPSKSPAHSCVSAADHHHPDGRFAVGPQRSSSKTQLTQLHSQLATG